MTYTDSLSEVGEPVPNMGKMLDVYYVEIIWQQCLKKRQLPWDMPKYWQSFAIGRHGSPCGCRNLEGRLGTGRQLCVLCRFHEWADHLCRCSRGKGRLSWGELI